MIRVDLFRVLMFNYITIFSMKRIAFIVALITTITANAQLGKFQLGELKSSEEIVLEKREYMDDYLGMDAEGNYYTMFHKGKGQFFMKFDPDFKLLKKVPFEVSSDKKDKREVAKMYFFGEDVMLFTQFRNKKLNKNFLFFQTINKNSLGTKSKARKIAELDMKSKFKSGYFDIRHSADSSKILVMSALPYSDLEPEEFNLKVFSRNDMELLWQKDYKLPYSDKLYHFENLRVDNNGDVHMLGILFNEKVKFVQKKKPNYAYHLITFSEKGKSVNDQEIKLTDKFITDLQFTIRKNGEISCAGFYSDQGTYSIKGTFYLRMDPKTSEVKGSSYKEFDTDFILMGLSAKQVEKKKKKIEKKDEKPELYKYKLDEIILRDDGGLVLIAEQYFVQVVTRTSTVNGRTTTTTTYHYYYNDIIVVNINPEGDIEWSRKIPKYQHTINDGGQYSGYVSMVVDDRIYFVYNDNPKNGYLDKKGEPNRFSYRRFKETDVVIVEVSIDGFKKKSILIQTEKRSMMVNPRMSSQISENDLLMLGRYGKSIQFHKLNIPD